MSRSDDRPAATAPPPSPPRRQSATATQQRSAATLCARGGKLQAGLPGLRRREKRDSERARAQRGGTAGATWGTRRARPQARRREEQGVRDRRAREASGTRGAKARGARNATSRPRVAEALNATSRPKAARLTLNRRRPTLPGPCGPSTIGAERLNFSVRNGKRCFPLAKATGNSRESRRPLKTAQPTTLVIHRRKKIKPSSPRAISTSLLRTLPHFQIWPINLVVYQGSYSLKEMGELILRLASRLDAFSGYPIRT